MIELLDAVTALGIDLANVAQAGPPTDLPAPVPDFVGEILGSVRSFLDGGVEKLGSTVSDLTPGGS
ncbi:uncharacterized protein HHUB_2113 [Halobacterium hubeiense]|uniref:Uncharacterized protein n=1 Tax=Halobacterium hubeiense TaxID=1407499 RepID=A0A0U5H5R2_9EURY|nr:hypothetical protein [Halobacterium hubeiense]CQH54671.1 uncharacterized protein HHUB_2113 [Halobacterium hubeiense]